MCLRKLFPQTIGRTTLAGITATRPLGVVGLETLFSMVLGFDLIVTVNNALTIDTVKLNSLYNSLATINPSVDIMQLDGGLGQAGHN